MTNFNEITKNDNITPLAALAREIWTECYTALLGAAQVEYMLTSMQSVEPLRRQLTEDAYRYFYLQSAGDTIGYLGIQVQDNALFLSKLYVREQARGHGTARDVMAFLNGFACGAHLTRIWLMAHRGNTAAMTAYERMGFRNIGQKDTPIGGGYIMTDYVFEKQI